MMDAQLMNTLATAGVTAMLTAYVTAKVNSAKLALIIDMLQSVQETQNEHEKRLSRLEGVITTEKVMMI